MSRRSAARRGYQKWRELTTPDHTDWPSEWMWPHIEKIMTMPRVVETLENDPDRIIVAPLVPSNRGKNICDRCYRPIPYPIGFILTMGRMDFLGWFCADCAQAETEES